MKKTRRASYRPVSRRPKSARTGYYDVKRNQRDKILRNKWQNNKSVLFNLNNINLKEYEDELADDELLKQITPEKSLNEMDTKIIAKLVEKHKDNYLAMSRDIKINVYQWTENQCKKKTKNFKEGNLCVASKKYLSHLIPSSSSSSSSNSSSSNNSSSSSSSGGESSGNSGKSSKKQKNSNKETEETTTSNSSKVSKKSSSSNSSSSSSSSKVNEISSSSSSSSSKSKKKQRA